MINLRTLRKQANLTMKQLGNEIGIAESTVSLYESGKRSPDVQILIRFADYFNVSLDELCGRDFSKPASAETMTDVESKFLADFQSLNKQGKEYMLQTMDMAVTIYKTDSISDVEKLA